ncbi:MAG: HTH domain-containing protein [Candidatus Aenigmarchaeota archaeon]|nr:HTH domain-containing protein [Candidatus Aenigmarchaeota archaeon]
MQKPLVNKKEIISIPESELVECIRKLLENRLTKKQRNILQYLNENRDESVTRSVKNISYLLNCSQSCIWNNINSLKKCGLIEVNGYVRLSKIFKVLIR